MRYNQRKQINKDYRIARLLPICLGSGDYIRKSQSEDEVLKEAIIPVKEDKITKKLDYSDIAEEWCEDNTIQIFQLIIDHNEENEFIIPSCSLLDDQRSYPCICEALKKFQLVKKATLIDGGIKCIIA